MIPSADLSLEFRDFMRPWDNYFWGRIFQIPTEAITLPLEWPPSSAGHGDGNSIGPNIAFA